MKKVFLAFALVLASSLAAMAADKPNIKWGKPSQEELEMTTYAPEPEAEAVVLHKETTTRLEYTVTDFKLRTQVKCRIKVLKPEGKDWANGSIVYHHNNGNPKMREVLETLKATSFNLVDGKVVKTPMSKDMIFNEDISKAYRRTKFTVPQVQEGTIIEYEYATSSDFLWDVDDWEAQTTIPVAYTHYTLVIPEYFKFNVVETGLCHLENDHKQSRMTLNFRNGVGTCNAGEYNYTGYNLPPLRKQPYCFNPRNYGQKVAAELRTIEIPGSTYKNYSTTWSDVDKTLMEDDDMGKRLNKNPFKDEMKAMKFEGTTEEKIAAIYKMVHDRVKWNDKYTLWATDKASNIIKNGSGSNADINFMLIAMLRDAGLKAYPVVLRTRDEGLLPFASPTINALSTFVVAVSDSEKTYYIDGSAEDGYINVLPSLLLASKARIIYDENNADWVDLSGITTATQNGHITAKVNADGSATGVRTERFSGLEAMDLRIEFKEAKDSAEYIHDIETSDNIEVKSCEHKGLKDFSNVVTRSIEFAAQCETAGDIIYVKPLMDDLMSKSPFTDEKREMPIEFPSKSNMQISCKIELPEGYAIEEMPKPLSFKSPDGTLAFKFLCNADQSSVTTLCTIAINSTLYAPADYPIVKAFFDEVVKAGTELIVLKKQQQ